MREVGDEVDRANDLAERENAHLLYQVRKKAGAQQEPLADGSYPFPDCHDCAEPIEPGRLKLGRIRCFSCQEDLERSGRR